MGNELETLKLEPRGENFILIREDGEGTQREILLSDANIQALAKQFPIWLKEILAKRQTAQMSQQGISPVIVIPIAQLGLNTDLHETEVHLSLNDEFGNWTLYSLSLASAKHLHRALPKWIERLDQAEADKRQQ